MSNYKKLKSIAYGTIKQKILNNELLPGEYLEEKKLCEMLNVSRTPIREAISRLEQEDLVQVIPSKGIFVTTVSVQAIKELFQARHYLEPMLLRLSFPNLNIDTLLEYKQNFASALEASDYPKLHQLDYDFHNYINSQCNNGYLIKMMNILSDNFQRVRTQEFYAKERTETGAREHLILINLLIDGDMEGATEYLGKHISSTEKYYFKSLI